MMTFERTIKTIFFSHSELLTIDCVSRKYIFSTKKTRYSLLTKNKLIKVN